MNFRKIFLTFFLVFNLTLLSQNSYEYFGILKLNGDDKTVITYRLIFKEFNGQINGYSITDLGGNHETKNIIFGNYDKKSKILNFKETDILYTKSTFDENAFCFVNFSNKIKFSTLQNKLEGNFEGLYKNKKKCINGTISLVGSEKINKLVNRVNNKIQKSKKLDVKSKDKFNTVKMMDSLKMNNLTSNQNLNIFWESDEVNLEVWDNGKIDDDKINIYVNDKLLLSNYSVVSSKKLINIKITEKSIIKIEAVNEGSISPNTARILLSDNKRTFELTSNLKKLETSSITILKK
ncbi:hypothetical protein [Flavobacterium sp.]|uniref:hypothetical protein n=1 Tax=Flavobacterium sp. TaxID=239 RepID=UPI003751FC56